MKLKELQNAISATGNICEPNTKLAYSYINHNLKEYNKLLDKKGGYNDKLNDKRFELSLTNTDGSIAYEADGKTFKYSKENLKKLMEFTKSLMEEEGYEMEFYITDYLVLSATEKEKIKPLLDEDVYKGIGLMISNLPPIQINELIPTKELIKE